MSKTPQAFALPAEEGEKAARRSAAAKRAAETRKANQTAKQNAEAVDFVRSEIARVLNAPRPYPYITNSRVARWALSGVSHFTLRG